MEKVYLEKRECYSYPESDYCFSPSIVYPEYPFADETLAPKPNEVYDMVRAALHGLGLDSEHYDTKDWNPLKGMLPAGGTVVLKPNWVRHFNGVGTMNCMVTHPSIIRCILDYCVIAGAGRIILGDAPVQGADIDIFLGDQGYWELQRFYSKNGIEVEIIDFRDLVVQVKNHVIISGDKPRIGHNEIVEIDLGMLSRHVRSKTDMYAICGYTKDKINEFHASKTDRHCYSLSKTVLEADLIINLPKPKTHRFAGITAAQKNFVGICPDKESLPHFRIGSTKCGGDETNNDSLHASLLWQVYERYLIFCKQGRRWLAYWTCAVHSILERTKRKYEYSKGSWHGNDTIWRTILDISLLVRYMDKNLSFCPTNRPRKILTIGDMIIAGEKSGPLDPSDKPLGIIMASTNCAAFDAVFCGITGFAHQLIPTVRESCNDPRLLPDGREGILLQSNLADLHGRMLNECCFPDEWRFKPSPFWAEILD